MGIPLSTFCVEFGFGTVRGVVLYVGKYTL